MDRVALSRIALGWIGFDVVDWQLEYVGERV